MLYIKQTSYGFAVCRFDEVIREFVTFEEAKAYLDNYYTMRKER